MTVKIITADVMDGLARIEADSVDCVVTSPPYWGQRDYGVDGQIGMEPALADHLDKMVTVFGEVRRVLKPHGVCWLNYGDCYACPPNGRSAADTKAAGKDNRSFCDKPFSTVGPVGDGPYLGEGPPSTVTRGSNTASQQTAIPPSKRVMAGGYLKPKDLCLIPERLMITLQDDGWWVRKKIIWGKSNPMPESVTDRPATAWEYIIMLTKSKNYFYDANAVRIKRRTDGEHELCNSRQYLNQNGIQNNSTPAKKQRGHARTHAGFNARWDRMNKAEQQANGRNLRDYEPVPAEIDVWDFATRPFQGAHLPPSRRSWHDAALWLDARLAALSLIHSVGQEPQDSSLTASSVTPS